MKERWISVLIMVTVLVLLFEGVYLAQTAVEKIKTTQIEQTAKIERLIKDGDERTRLLIDMAAVNNCLLAIEIGAIEVPEADQEKCKRRATELQTRINQLNTSMKSLQASLGTLQEGASQPAQDPPAPQPATSPELCLPIIGCLL